MEFRWDRQGPHYTRYDSIPRRNPTYDYRTKHQGSHCLFYYGEQQDSGTECSYWTVPGSRRGRALQDSADQIFAPSSSNLPFILDAQTRQQRAVEEHLQREARGRERAAAQLSAGRYDGGSLRRGGWQRGNGESTGYLELKAWAAQRSLSLPRRRNVWAESRGRSNGLSVNSETPERDGRTWADLQVAALDRIRQSAKIKDSKFWDGGDGQQTHQLQAPVCDLGPLVDTKEKTRFQKMMFSRPPGYVAPPPYDSPHTTAPVIPHRNAGCEQEINKDDNWTRAKPERHEESVGVEGRRRAENPDQTRPKTCDVDSDYSFNSLSLGTDQSVTPKVIEGKRFRIRRKTGGLTIFCLVSRIADATETSSLPLCSSRLDVQDAGLVEVLTDKGEIHQTQTFADEVDFKVPPRLTEPPTSSSGDDATEEKKILTSTDTKIADDCPIKQSETPGICLELKLQNETDSTPGGRERFVESTSLKHPLWRTPSLMRRAATERENTDGVESRHPCNQENENNVPPVDVDVGDLHTDLVPDTSCVVKMELVPSPTKDHVCYLSSTVNSEENTNDGSNIASPTDQEVRSDVELNFPLIKDRSVKDFGCGFTSSKKETLEERAERILGISVQGFLTEKHQEEEAAVHLQAQLQDDVGELSPQAGDVHVAKDVISEDTDESLESCETDTPENQDSEKQVEGEDDSEFLQNDSQPFAGFEEKIENSETLETRDVATSAPISDKSPEKQNQDERPADNSSTKEPSQSSTPRQSFSTPDESSESFPLHVAPSTTDEDPTPESASFITSENLPSHYDSPSPHPPGPEKPSPISSPLHLDLTPVSEEPPSDDEIPDDSKTSQFVNDEVSDTFKNLEDQDVVSTASGEESDVADEGQTEDEDVLESHEAEEPQIPEADEVDEEPAELGEATATDDISGGQTLEKVNVCLQYLVNDEDGFVACEEETVVIGERAERDVSEGTSCSCQTPDESKVENDLEELDFDQEESASCEIISETKDHLDLDSAGNLSTFQNTSPDCPGRVQPDQAEVFEMLNPGDETADPDCETMSSGVFSELPSSLHASQKDLDVITPDDCQEMDPDPSIMSTASHDTSGDLSLDHYPRSLWDAVNRIRKHTAPDSENEEEEVGEQWDPEMTEEELCSADTLLAFNNEMLACADAAEHLVLTVPCDVDPSRCAEDDTLSCCSFSSQSSGDTVVGEEEEVEELPLDQSSMTTEEEQGCVEVSDERE